MDAKSQVMRKALLVLLLLVVPNVSSARYSGGTGEPNNPYRIATAEDLNDIGNHIEDWGSHFLMVNDINLAAYTGTQFNIIGDSNNPFAGVFDGNGHAILSFTYVTSKSDSAGLFRQGVGVTIKNIGLIRPVVAAPPADNVGALIGYISGGTNRLSQCYVLDPNVRGNDHVGALVGYIAGQGNAKIYDCYVEGGSITGDWRVGGLVGRLAGHVGIYATISRCYAITNVNANVRVGGLIGQNGCASVSKCYSKGSVSGNYKTGGLVGANTGESIFDCYSVADVFCPDTAGGLVGSTCCNGFISLCYSAGAVEGVLNAGGLLGRNDSSHIYNCFWDIETSGQMTMCGEGGLSGGCDDSYGLTTADMGRPGIFIDARWDFISEKINGLEDVWRCCASGSGHPNLTWQYKRGDLDCRHGVDFVDIGVMGEQWLVQELAADIGPNGRDGIVSLLDWAVFANAWRATGGMRPSFNWDPRCDLAPKWYEEIIDEYDLAIFLQYWLESGQFYLMADIAPDGGDGVVNLADFGVLAAHWLEGQ